ncbi:RICIN domain-containing protein [Amycolatopsis sp. NPDC057786]|uniref:RICIN domain-containing protein n=1 Tax=Amycolatopsis sp. NPDC057786 TaxID=3346250 RepID=UPI00367112A0
MKAKIIGLLSAALAVTALAAPPAGADGYYRVRNYGSNKCIQPHPNNPLAELAAVVQMPCNNNAVQKWAIVPNTHDTVYFVNQASGFCLNVVGKNTNRAPVNQVECNDNSNQRWIPPLVVPNAVPKFIYSRVGGGDNTIRCLDAKGETADLTQMQIYTCQNDHPMTHWLIHP